MASILLVEDDAAHAELMIRSFRRSGQDWAISVAGSLAEARRRLAEEPFDLVVSDYRLPDGEGLQLIGAAPGGQVDLPVLVLTSQGSESVAVDAIRRGALDYVVKSAQSFEEMPLHASRALRARAFILEKRRAETELRRSLAEKEILLKEIHHRVKNNFQIVSSLLSLQADALEEGPARAALRESEDRIKSMALIHEKLYDSQDYARIDFGDYLRTMASRLEAIFKGAERGIEIEYRTEPLELSIEIAIPLGLVLNELVTNALIHAFPEGRRGKISLGLSRQGEELELFVDDDGIGLPPGVDLESHRSLGFELVRVLSAQAGARARIVSSERGSSARLRLPLESGQRAAEGEDS